MGKRNSNVEVHDRHLSVAEEPVTSVLKGGDIPWNDSGKEWDADEQVLAALGYKVRSCRTRGRTRAIGLSKAYTDLVLFAI